MNMDKTRRRRPRALGAIIVLLAGNGLGASAFGSLTMYGSSGSSSIVSNNNALNSHSAALPSVSGRVNSPQRRPFDQQAQHQRRPRILYGADAAANSRTALAGAVDASAEIDHFDGWNPRPETEVGTVSLVGSGPGDPDLLTVAGLRELQSADLVIADRLVSKEILGLVSTMATRVVISCVFAAICGDLHCTQLPTWIVGASQYSRVGLFSTYLALYGLLHLCSVSGSSGW